MSTTTPASNELDLLTPKQREVFTLLAKGYTAQEVAALMKRSLGATRAHIDNAHTTTELTTIEIIVLMAKAGWV